MNQPAFLELGEHGDWAFGAPAAHADFKIKWLDQRAKAPERAYDSAGFDIRTYRSVHLPPHQPVGICVGFATEFPSCYVAKVFGRSSLAAKGIIPLGGVIDADYRGEWKIILINLTNDGQEIEAGDKIAQFLFIPIARPNIQITERLSVTERNLGGGGSTGR